jgi:hypothetical protein
MAPPKQEEASQTTRQPRVRTRSQVQLEEGEQNSLEIINIDEIPSPDTTPVNPTLVVEKSQQPTPEGTSIDTPTGEQGQQNHDTEAMNEVQPENIEATPRVNGTATNPKAAVEPDESQTTKSDHVHGGTC